MNSNLILKEKLDNNLVIEVEYDGFIYNPREVDYHMGIMVCWHKRYDLGDKDHGIDLDGLASIQEVRKFIEEERNGIGILPLYLLDHSGITISTKPFNDPWDSGQVGFIYTTAERAQTYFRTDKLEEALTAEVEEYDRYLRGESYGFRIKKACPTCGHHGEEIESCWGFGNPNEALEAAKEML